MTGRKKEAVYTVTGNLILQIITAVCGFVLPPLIITAFGSPVNGMVSSIGQFIAYLNIVEAGVGGASTAALYKPLAANDAGGCNGILSATRLFYNRSGIMFTVLVFVLAFVYPAIVGTQVDRLSAGLMVLVLGITGAAEFFLIGKYRVLLTADKKTYVLSLVQSAAVIVNTAVAVILIKTESGILTVKLVSSAVYLCRYFFLALYVNKKYSGLNFRAVPDRKAVSQSKNVLVHQIGGLVVFNSPVVLITIFCSLKDASVYTVYAMVFTAMNNLLGAFSNGIQSFFGESLVKDDIERTRNIFSRYETLFFTVEGWFYSMTYLLVMPFMSIYTAGMTDAEYIQPELARLFVIVGVLNNLRQPGNQLINAAGHFKKTQWRSLTEAGINVVCSILFTIKMGFTGVLLGGICSYLYRTVDIIIYTAVHILHKKPFKSVIKISGLSVYFVTVLRLITHVNVKLPSYAAWVGYAVICGLILAVPLSLPAGIIWRKRR